MLPQNKSTRIQTKQTLPQNKSTRIQTKRNDESTKKAKHRQRHITDFTFDLYSKRF